MSGTERPDGDDRLLDLPVNEPPQPTGDPEADAVLARLWERDRADPDQELDAFQTALNELTGLTQDQPRLPGQE